MKLRWCLGTESLYYTMAVSGRRGAWSRPWLWRPWDWRAYPVLWPSCPPRIYLPASLISGHSQFWDFLVSLSSGMLCCVLLSTDSGHCTHGALEFLRMEFPPRFSDNFHLISLKKKKKRKNTKTLISCYSLMAEQCPQSYFNAVTILKVSWNLFRCALFFSDSCDK